MVSLHRLNADIERLGCLFVRQSAAEAEIYNGALCILKVYKIQCEFNKVGVGTLQNGSDFLIPRLFLGAFDFYLADACHAIRSFL